MTTATVQRRDLRAMNSDIELVCYAADAERRLTRAEHWLRGFEARFSRFQTLSELSRLNAAAGRPFPASPGLFRLVEKALALAERSGGIFDPTVLRDLEAAGYDRSFELLSSQMQVGSVSPLSLALSPGGRGDIVVHRRHSWRDVRLDPTTRMVSMPAGCGIDLGGIGKGWAVDRLAAIIGSPGLVNGGGDVFAAGRPDDEEAWLVGVADPFAPERDLGVLAVRDRGVATSSSLRRRWQNGDRLVHHLIDPRTGRPSASDVVQATVVAPNTLLADYHAKVALLLGAEAGKRYLDQEEEVEGLLVVRDGAIRKSSGLDEYVN
jgi:thiamine biosynthesis lipoprotein